MYFCSIIKLDDSMKKRVLLLLPLFLGACSDGGESPIIKIEKLSVKVDSDNNSRMMKNWLLSLFIKRRKFRLREI